MSEVIKKKLNDSLNMINEITEYLAAESYSKHLGSLRSNTIGQQLWCLAGARESYLDGIKSDTDFQWICSLDFEKANFKIDIDQYLKGCSLEIATVFKDIGILTDNQLSLALDLMAHEYQHQGQLIRYIYANGIHMPKSRKEFWHLD